MDKYARGLQILEMQHKRDEMDRKILELQHEAERAKGSTGQREDRRFEEIVVEYPPEDSVVCRCEASGDWLSYIRVMTGWCRHWAKEKYESEVKG